MRCQPFHSSHQVQDRWKHFHHFDHLECREKQVQQAKERNWILILYTESSSCVHSLISWVLRQKSSTFRSNPRFKLWSICRQQLPLRLKFPIWSISPLSIFPLFYHSSCSPPHGGELLKIHDSRNGEKLISFAQISKISLLSNVIIINLWQSSGLLQSKKSPVEKCTAALIIRLPLSRTFLLTVGWLLCGNCYVTAPLWESATESASQCEPHTAQASPASTLWPGVQPTFHIIHYALYIIQHPISSQLLKLIWKSFPLATILLSGCPDHTKYKR